ncbi:GCN5 family acetyltransferase [Pseudonocardia sp. HH130630-07]|nr:GCN5 family acetyltransferase [Pseudonocardia sp. HH130630-07]
MTPAEFDVYIGRQLRERVAALTVALAPHAARAKAHADHERLLPHGRETAGHEHLVAENARGRTVGQLWLGRHEPQTGSGEIAWIYDVRVEEPFRRSGYARAILAGAEARARRAGAARLGLNVLGHNAAAIALYESRGYAVTAQQMAKPLD